MNIRTLGLCLATATVALTFVPAANARMICDNNGKNCYRENNDEGAAFIGAFAGAIVGSVINPNPTVVVVPQRRVFIEDSTYSNTIVVQPRCRTIIKQRRNGTIVQKQRCF